MTDNDKIISEIWSDRIINLEKWEVEDGDTE